MRACSQIRRKRRTGRRTEFIGATSTNIGAKLMTNTILGFSLHDKYSIIMAPKTLFNSKRAPVLTL